MTRWPRAAMIAGQAIADDGRAEVAHVHRLGDVGRGEVDHDGLGAARGVQAEALVGQQVPQCRGDPVVVQADVEEPGAGDLGRAGDGSQVDTASAISAASSRGLRPMALARAMQPLAW